MHLRTSPYAPELSESFLSLTSSNTAGNLVEILDVSCVLMDESLRVDADFNRGLRFAFSLDHNQINYKPNGMKQTVIKKRHSSLTC